MEKEFEEIYEKINEEYKEKYISNISKNSGMITAKIIIAIIIISSINLILKNFLGDQNAIILLSTLIEFILVFVLIILLYKNATKRLDYWKKATIFKEEVGTKFWKLINPENNYISKRENINKQNIKKELDLMLSDDVNIIDVEESLEFENKKMYTVKYSDKNLKRFNGTLVIIEKNIEQIEERLKSSELAESIYKIELKENKTYILLDVLEVFHFSEKDFLNKNELYEDYLNYKIIKNL